MKHFDFYRGMAHPSLFTLAMWEILVISLCVVQAANKSAWDLAPFYVFFAVIIPALVWLLWRALLLIRLLSRALLRLW
jgi:hypothetical protein